MLLCDVLWQRGSWLLSKARRMATRELFIGGKKVALPRQRMDIQRTWTGIESAVFHSLSYTAFSIRVGYPCYI